MSFRELLNWLNLSIPKCIMTALNYINAIADYIFELVSRALIIGALYASNKFLHINNTYPVNFLYIIYFLILVYIISSLARAAIPILQFGNYVCSISDTLNKSYSRLVIVGLLYCIVLVFAWYIFNFIGDIINTLLTINTHRVGPT